MTKQNCWEYYQCGREPGGTKTTVLGVCPASIDTDADGMNSGKNAGRICWAVAGTHCDGNVQAIHIGRKDSCMDCSFYQKVKAEEGFLEYRILKPDQIK